MPWAQPIRATPPNSGRWPEADIPAMIPEESMELPSSSSHPPEEPIPARAADDAADVSNVSMYVEAATTSFEAPAPAYESILDDSPVPAPAPSLGPAHWRRSRILEGIDLRDLPSGRPSTVPSAEPATKDEPTVPKTALAGSTPHANLDQYTPKDASTAPSVPKSTDEPTDSVLADRYAPKASDAEPADRYMPKESDFDPATRYAPQATADAVPAPKIEPPFVPADHFAPKDDSAVFVPADRYAPSAAPSAPAAETKPWQTAALREPSSVQQSELPQEDDDEMDPDEEAFFRAGLALETMPYNNESADVSYAPTSGYVSVPDTSASIDDVSRASALALDASSPPLVQAPFPGSNMPLAGFTPSASMANLPVSSSVSRMRTQPSMAWLSSQGSETLLAPRAKDEEPDVPRSSSRVFASRTEEDSAPSLGAAREPSIKTISSRSSQHIVSRSSSNGSEQRTSWEPLSVRTRPSVATSPAEALAEQAEPAQDKSAPTSANPFTSPTHTKARSPLTAANPWATSTTALAGFTPSASMSKMAEKSTTSASEAPATASQVPAAESKDEVRSQPVGAVHEPSKPSKPVATSTPVRNAAQDDEWDDDELPPPRPRAMPKSSSVVRIVNKDASESPATSFVSGAEDVSTSKSAPSKRTSQQSVPSASVEEVEDEESHLPDLPGEFPSK